MELKTAFIPYLGRQIKFGRVRSPAMQPRLKLSNYLLKSLPSPPASVDYTPKAMASLNQVYGNSELGDCVIACMAHVAGILTGNADGNPLLFTQQQIIALYSAIGGYVPGNPATDRGCSIQDALNFWRSHGAPIGSHQIVGAIRVDPSNPEEYRTALWLFENLVFGVELPDAWIANPMPGFVWQPGTPDPQNGHCICGAGYGSQGVTVATWGMLGAVTDAAMKYNIAPQAGGELYAVISQDAISKATLKAPNGFNWSQLVADFDAMGGNVPVPVPPPAPVPIPPVPVPPTPPAPTPAPVDWIAVLNALVAWLQQYLAAQGK